MKVKEFNGAVKRGVSSALKELKEEGVDSYMLDLRGNLGGVLEGSLEIAGPCMDKSIWSPSRNVGVLTKLPRQGYLWMRGQARRRRGRLFTCKTGCCILTCGLSLSNAHFVEVSPKASPCTSDPFHLIPIDS